MTQPECIQLIKIDEDDKLVYGPDALKKLKELLLCEDVKDRLVVVVSIAGALRTGKSFLLSFLLKYLRYMYSNENSTSREGSWLGEESAPLEGFEWKCGQEPVTTGIQMWPEIFRATLPGGEKVAIILLDTQGLFDSNTTFEVNTKIFALSTMISSLNVYNLSQRIQEDNLQFLKFFTDYSSEAVQFRGNKSNVPFGKLLFLVRDYACGQKTGYGYGGGQIHKNTVLEIKDDQKLELKSVRKLINSSFSHVDGFVMPYPGCEVAEESTFDGRLSVIRKVFRDCLEELVPSLLSLENLTPKTIEGHKIKAADLYLYVVQYVNKLNSDEMPRPRSIFEANAEVSYHLAFADAIAEYKRRMEILCSNEHAVEKDIFDKHHEECAEIAHTHFRNHSKFDDKNLFVIFGTKIDEEIHRLYESFFMSNQKKKEIDELLKRMSSGKTEMNRAIEEQVKQLRQEIDEINRKQNESLTIEQLVGRIFTLGIPYLYQRLTNRNT